MIEAVDGAGGLAVLRSDARLNLLVTDVGLLGGMNGHLDPGVHVLTKPFTMDTLASRISDIIDGA